MTDLSRDLAPPPVLPFHAPDTVPPGRGRWRILLRRRPFAQQQLPEVLADLTGARSRRLVRELNKAAQFTFVLDGHSAAGHLIRELEHEIVVHRWDDLAEADVEMFRGVITASQDTLSEQRHSVSLTATDYLGVLGRRLYTRRLTYTNVDQDTIVESLLTWATTNLQPSSGQFTFGAVAFLPMAFARVFPDGSPGRGLSGRIRVRDYLPQQNAGEAIENLAAVIDGFDFDYFDNQLRIFYPYRGVQRSDWAFVYGSTVGALSRTTSSADFGNYWRVIGQAEGDALPPYSEGWITSPPIQDVTPAGHPEGLWQLGDSMGDVTQVATLADRVGWLRGQYGQLLPKYSLSLRPGAWDYGDFEVGDTARLLIRSGRLDVDSWARIVAQTFDIGDDGQENIECEVSRPEGKFFDLIRGNTRRVATLERR